MSSASTISNLLDASATANGFSAAGRKDAAKELNDRFLKLLVAQMKNQDPLNPLDNAQVTSQMAQINTVTGI
ncbi:MAG: flagellar hook assembly protein FlgD, partial [Burkholderiaceae bacterium]|nr:flagellar hook assembly protein FlgD [Burkholderiaceae bacterium]